MSEEKKEDTVQEPKKEAPAPEARQATPAPAAAPAQAVPAAEKSQSAPVKKEKPSNCAGCSKSITKKRWYYRNGKFYCSKRCWTTAIKKEEKKEEAQAPK